jgi:tetratricopeptide (TPR) repeat protein
MPSVRARILAGLLCGVAALLLIGWSSRGMWRSMFATHPEEAVWAAHLAAAGQDLGNLEILYPLDEAVFPAEIAEPTFRWRDPQSEADAWCVLIEFADGTQPIKAFTRASRWTPSPEQWCDVTTRSVESPARVTVLGVKGSATGKILSSGTVRIRTSADPVGAPLFFREVNLPFETAVKDPAKHIRWRFGPVSAREPPPIVLQKLPVCGNCHSFSRDGGTLAMEVDSGNQKGGYAIAPVAKEMVLDPLKIINWNEYRREDGQVTFGLLCQISPDGRYVAGTVKDRALAVYRPDLMFSQLFFLIKGILAIYDRQARTFQALPGADDPQFVQTNATWSPDGQTIVFARSRSKAYDPESLRKVRSVVVPAAEAQEFLKGGRTFLYDLYRVPFNQGRGGKAEPIPGAANNGMSNYFPKFSPDGRWIVFCKARSFMLLQPDSELWIMPAAGGEARRLRCNTGRMNSWHSWSPNGKWLVFSSKLNGPYTQLFLTHIDEQGDSAPAVVLDRFTAPERAANIPEFVNQPADAMAQIREQFMDDHSHWRVGDAFALARDWKSAEGVFRQVLALNPRSFEARFSLGFVLAKMGQWSEAISCYEQALRLDPDNAAVHCSFGSALDNAGRPEEAMSHLRRALELKPDLVEAHNNLGTLLGRLGRAEEGVIHFRQALRFDPKSAAAHYNLAMELDKQGRVDEAIAHYRKALEGLPDFAPAHNHLGAALLRTGRAAEAIPYFQRALQLMPTYAKARFNLQQAEAAASGLERAIRTSEEAAQASPRSPEGLDALAAAYAAAGRFPEAIATAEKAARLATAAGKLQLAKQIDDRLASYRSARADDEQAAPLRRSTDQPP